MHYVRAALLPAVLLAACALAGCGSEGTTDAGEPPVIPSIQVTTTPTPAPTPTQAAAPMPAPTPTPVAKTTTTTTKPTISKPTTTTKQVVELRTIPFTKRTVTDDSLPKGERTIQTTGVNGTRRLVYKVTYVNGVQTAKELLRQEVAKQPRTQVTAVGTKVEEEPASSGCDPNYSGCVPIASDVDCSGGSGNGPEYVAGPVRVIGSDIYGLDSDDDGVGCED